MRWDGFFEDLEHQLDHEWEAERAALDTEAERLRLARLPLRARVAALAGTGCEVAVDLPPETTLRGRLTGGGADWVTLDTGSPRAALVPLGPILAIGMPQPDVLRSARPVAVSASAERMTFGFVLRELVRRRAPVGVHTVNGRLLTGTIDRAGVDHLDIALHDASEPRRATAVDGMRIVPFAAIAWVALDSPRP